MLFKADGNAESLETAGLALSIVEHEKYIDDKVDLNPGDTLLIYSDGVTEAMNEEKEEFGEDRLFDILRVNADNSAQDIVEAISGSVQAYLGEAEQNDDMTIVVIKRN